MTTQEQKALELALEALETYHGYMEPLLTVFGGSRVPAEKSTTYKVEKAITAIKEALAQPEQEPVAWMVTSEMQDGTKNTYPLTGRFKDVKDVCDFGNPVPLYTTPPQRKPLTDEQIDTIIDVIEVACGFTHKAWDAADNREIVKVAINTANCIKE